MADDLFDSDEWADLDAMLAGLDEDQRAFVEAVRARKGNVQSPAGAGAGKTRAVVAAISALVHDGVPESQIIATTFTARAGDELRQRLAQVLGARRAAQVRVGTFHSLAMRAVKAAQLPVLCDSSRNLDGDGERRATGVPHANLLWSRILGYRAIAELRNKPGLDIDLKALDLSVSDYGLAVGLIRSRNIDYADLRAAKEAAKDVTLPQFWKAWGYYEEAKLSLEAFDFADVLAAYRDGLAAGTIKDSAEIVIVDECFPGDTPVLLADGTTLSIAEVVARALTEPIHVLSYDVEKGVQVKRKVVGVKRVPCPAQLVRIVFDRVAFRPDGRRMDRARMIQLGMYPRRTLVCTPTHRVRVNNVEWVEAQHVRVGQRLHMESDAPVVSAYHNKYKIGAKGREKLAQEVAVRAMPRVKPTSRNLCNAAVRKGNGHGPTVPESRLLSALGHDWCLQHAIPTKRARRTGYPTCYKVDIAHVGCKIAIEVDGASHGVRARRAQDAKKTALLESLGWRVVRVSNTEAAQQPEVVARRIRDLYGGACPIEAEVVSVEPYTIKDYNVYDISIEGTHCYYANGVLVHNCQDDDEVQTRIAALLAGEHPLSVCGDEKQAIFSWRGASPGFFLDFAKRFHAKLCPLRRNYRSVPAIVEMGNRIARDKPWSLGVDAIAVRPAPLFPTIRKLPGARNPIEEGELVAKRIRSALDEGAKPDDFAVLARTNAILGAYETGFIRHRVPCVVIGGQGFFTRKEAQAVLAYAALIGHDSPTQLEKVLDTPKRFLGAKFMEEIRAEWKPGANLVEVIRRVAPRVRGKANALADDIERLRVAGWPSAEDMRHEDEPDALALDGPASRDDEARLRGLALIAQILLGKKEETDDDSAEARDPEKDTAAMTWAAVRIAATFPSPKALYEFAKLCMASVGGVDGERARNKQNTRGKVVLSTVFKAKGLEYRHVVVSASDGNFPHARSIKAWKKGDRSRIEEEERLFYVATTRAQDRLEFAWSVKDLYHRDAGPSPFLAYIEGMCETYVGEYVDEDGDGYGRRDEGDEDDDWLDKGPPPARPTPTAMAMAPTMTATATATATAPAATLTSNVLPFPARSPKPEPREWTGNEWKAARAVEVERLTTVPVPILAKSDRAALEALLLPLGFVWHSGAFRGRSRGTVDLDIHPWPHARVTATFDTPRGPRPVVPEPPILRYTARWRVDLLDLLDTVNDQVWQAPSCPECHSPCHVRGNDRGKFWGCMRFPDCRGISREKVP